MAKGRINCLTMALPPKHCPTGLWLSVRNYTLESGSSARKKKKKHDIALLARDDDIHIGIVELSSLM